MILYRRHNGKSKVRQDMNFRRKKKIGDSLLVIFKQRLHTQSVKIEKIDFQNCTDGQIATDMRMRKFLYKHGKLWLTFSI